MQLGTYKVRNEIETKRNEINENENEIKRNQTDYWVWCLTPLSTNFSYIVGVSFIGGGKRRAQRKTRICHKRKRNETKRNEINKNETKRIEINEMKTK
jgi:hypothetical protein